MGILEELGMYRGEIKKANSMLCILSKYFKRAKPDGFQPELDQHIDLLSAIEGVISWVDSELAGMIERMENAECE